MDDQARENHESAQAVLMAMRRAQRAWAQGAVAKRCRVIDLLRRLIAERCDDLIDAVTHAQPTRPREQTVAAEILPLADACKFASRHAKRILTPRRLGMWGRPLWLAGSTGQVVRMPLGVVLVIGPSNYPLFLPGVQAIQALVAGNAVLLKPGRGGTKVAQALAALLKAAGLPDDLFHVTGESPDTAKAFIDSGVDHIVLTGSAATGCAVLTQAAEKLTPVTAELSGSDAMIVREDADLDLVIRAVIFGLTLNGSQTCIAPRRILVHHRVADTLARQLAHAIAKLPSVTLDRSVTDRLRLWVDDAQAAGGVRLAGQVKEQSMSPILLAGARPDMQLLREDIFAPIVSLVTVESDQEAIAADSQCPYALGASIFGSPQACRRIARELRAGCVTINDVIAPTADPRVPFGGTARSGFGITRGPEGLLAMTRPQAVLTRNRRWRFHLRDPSPSDERILKAILAAMHRRGLSKLAAIKSDKKQTSRADSSASATTREHRP